MKRGDVVRVGLDPREGREIRKTRPAVVVSNNAACTYDSVVQVVPISRLPERPLRPYESLVDTDTSGLANPSRAVANQVRTIAKHRITKALGELAPDALLELDRALSIQLGLPVGR
jgi:mRNA interferase MazF